MNVLDLKPESLSPVLVSPLLPARRVNQTFRLRGPRAATTEGQEKYLFVEPPIKGVSEPTSLEAQQGPTAARTADRST